MPSKQGDALKVPELEGFRTVYVADIPSGGKFGAGNYSVDNAAKAGAFSRVAYVMEPSRRSGTSSCAPTASA